MSNQPASNVNQHRTTPLGVLRYACEYYAAAEAADDMIGGDDGHERIAPMVVNFLVGQAVELALKSFLLEKGFSVGTLRNRPYGHNLLELFDSAVKAGFGANQGVGAKERSMLELLNGPYMNRELQYFEGGVKNAFPVFGPLQAATVKILREAFEHVPDAELLKSRLATEAVFRCVITD